jgi:hypothetical protein
LQNVGLKIKMVGPKISIPLADLEKTDGMDNS